MVTPKIPARELGQIRIYTTPGEKPAGLSFWRRWFCTQPFYTEIIRAAKQAGLLSATACQTYYGFYGSDAIRSEGVEVSNPALTLWVEITGPRRELEAFCRQHAEALHNKLVLYQIIEEWQFLPLET